MKNKYKHIFFDLDRTLWDFDKNAETTLLEIHHKFSLEGKIPDIDDFVKTYNINNDKLWDDLREGKVKKHSLKTERFRLTLEKYGITDEAQIEQIGRYYLDHCPVKPALIPGAKELLKYLDDFTKLYIISNGFYDIQLSKLKSSGIAWYFEKIYTSDTIGSAKPSVEIFEYALNSSNAKKVESIMVGDDLTNDIGGARNYGIDQIYFNPKRIEHTEHCTYEVNHLSEIENIL